MLKINKRIKKEFIEEYIENAIEYLTDRSKKVVIVFNIDDYLDSLKSMLISENFKEIYEDSFKRLDLQNLFTYEVKNNNGEIKYESVYDNFRCKVLLKNNKRKNRKTRITKEHANSISNKVSDLYKDIIKDLDIKVCPYCGRNHIGFLELKVEVKKDTNNVVENNLNNDDKSNQETVLIVPTLDHFYPKSIYKQFSISLYNLIPSCNLCNLTLKHNKDEKELLFPYKEGFEDYVKFNLGNNSEEDLMKVAMLLTGDSNVDTSDLNIKLVKNEKKLNQDKSITDKEGFIKRCINSNNMFHLEEIYNSEHKQNALDLLNKIVWYRKNYIKSLNNILPLFDDNLELKIFGSENNQLFALIDYFNRIRKQLKVKFGQDISLDDLLGENFEFLFGRWLDPENDLKEPLSKFYRDIYKQITEPHLYEPL